LDFEFDDEERGVFDVDAEEACIEMFGSQCLDKQSVDVYDKSRKWEERTASL